MRKSKVVNIEGRGEVTVKEVSPWSVYQAWSAEDRLGSLEARASDAVSPGLDVIRSWYASELHLVLTAFLEVNSSFFEIARQLQLGGLLDEVIKSLSTTLPSAFASSFSQAMQTPGTTDGPFS